MSGPYLITSLRELRTGVTDLLRRVYVDEWGKPLATPPEQEGPSTIIAIHQGRVVGTAELRRGDSITAADRVRFDLAHFERVGEPDAIGVGGRLAVAPDLRASSLSLDLVKASIGSVPGVRLVFTACQPHLLNLYAQLGFRSYRPAVSDPGVGILAPVVLNLADGAGLLQLRSPLADSARDDPALAGDLGRGIEAAPGFERRCRRAQDGGLLFRDLGPTGLLERVGPLAAATLLANAWVIPCAPDALLIARGQAVRTMFLVLDGQVGAWSDGRQIDAVAQGGFVGELSYLLGVRQRYDLRAGPAGATLLAVPVRAFRRVSEERAAESFLVALAESIGGRQQCL